MYVDKTPVRRNGKLYRRVLLRESVRRGNKVQKITRANLSDRSDEEIAAIELALRNPHEVTTTTELLPEIELQHGRSVGAVVTLQQIARQLGIVRILGSSRQGKLALWQVIARVIDQGSRLSAVRLAACSAACEVLGLSAFHEDHLYTNLRWLSRRQAQIEDGLFAARHLGSPQAFFFYDITSSYLEGEKHELGAFGLNRDKKKRKQQIVAGLLCDERGEPCSIQVYPGNTSDQTTFLDQLQKVRQRFGGGEVTFIGDRGMIKGPQIHALHAARMHYITGLSRPQIVKLLKQGTLQMSLFDEHVAEVVDADSGVRYLLRRNPLQAEKMAHARAKTLARLRARLTKENQRLADHPLAKLETSLKHAQAARSRLKLQDWVAIHVDGRVLAAVVDDPAKARAAELDGCYVLRTDLLDLQIPKQTLHDRYKGLSDVERAFRTMKSDHLEIRPLHLRKADTTRGYAVVVMLAYLVVRELARRWQAIDLTVEEGVRELHTLCTQEIRFRGRTLTHRIPDPNPQQQLLLTAANVKLAKITARPSDVVATRKPLPRRRKKRE
jgi:transposase